MIISELFSALITNIADIPVPALMTIVVLANLAVVALALWIVGRCIEGREKQ